MSRWKAAAIHLSISLVIGLLALALLFGVWFPPPYFHAAGADELVMLLVGVDLTLGPLLTLIVFKSGKKSLKFDLACIGIAQTLALCYGMSVVLRTRPVFIVAAIDRFNLVSADDLSPEDLAAGTKPEFRTLSWTGPRLVGTKAPSDHKEHSDLMFSGLAGKDIERFPKYYVDYASQAAPLLARAKPLDDLRSRKPDSAKLVDRWLSDHHRDAQQVVWLPVMTHRASVTMLLDRSNGQPVGALEIDPW
jgi:hypothetical protein